MEEIEMEKFSVNIKDFAEICRLCSQKETTLHFIFKSEQFPRNHNIFLSIKRLIDSEISESDDLPKNVCDSCFLSLYRFDEFRSRCRESMMHLKSLIEMKCVGLIKDEPKVANDDTTVHANEEEQLTIKEETPGEYRHSMSRSCKTLSKPIIFDKKNLKPKIGISSKRKKSLDNIKTKRKKCLTVKSFTPKKSLHDSDSESEKSKAVEKQKGGKQMCPICGILVTYIKYHMRVHTDEKEFPCDLCDKTFKSRGIVKQHKRTVHSSVRSFPCTHCTMSFKTYTLLERHAVIHTGERKYKCTLCDKSFYSAAVFKNHNLTHTQERKHECKFCHTKFLTRQGLLHHMPKHTGEKPYQCGVCTMRFCYSSAATQHRRNHMKNNAYVCSFCTLEFRDMRMFRIHHVDVHKVQLPLASTSDNTDNAIENEKEIEKGKGSGKESTVKSELILDQKPADWQIESNKTEIEWHSNNL